MQNVDDENRKLKEKIKKLKDQIEINKKERFEMLKTQVANTQIQFEQDNTVTRLKKKIQTLKQQINEVPLSAKQIENSKTVLLEINRNTKNNFITVEECICFMNELQEYKNSIACRKNFRYKQNSGEVDELSDRSLENDEKYKLENRKFKEELKKKNKEIDDLMVDIELAKNIEQKYSKLNARVKEQAEKLEELEIELESKTDEIKSKDKKIADLQNEGSLLVEEKSTLNRQIEEVKIEVGNLKKVKLEMSETIENLNQEKLNLLQTKDEEIKKKQKGLDTMRYKVDNHSFEINELTEKLENLNREKQTIIDQKNEEITKKDKSLSIIQSTIEQKKNEIQELEVKISKYAKDVNELQKNLQCEKDKYNKLYDLHKNQKKVVEENEIRINELEKEISKYKVNKSDMNDSSKKIERPIVKEKPFLSRMQKSKAGGEKINCPNCQKLCYAQEIEQHLEQCLENSY